MAECVGGTEEETGSLSQRRARVSTAVHGSREGLSETSESRLRAATPGALPKLGAPARAPSEVDEKKLTITPPMEIIWTWRPLSLRA